MRRAVLDVPERSDGRPHAGRYAERPFQVLDRRDPVLPLSPGRAERHGFEYVRHDTLSLYAALNTHTGEGTCPSTEAAA